jgi:hypothetical protein
MVMTFDEFKNGVKNLIATAPELVGTGNEAARTLVQNYANYVATQEAKKAADAKAQVTIPRRLAEPAE